PIFNNNPEAYLLPGMFAVGALFAILKSYIVIEWKFLFFFWLALQLINDPMLNRVILYTGMFYTSILIATRPWVIQSLKLPFDASYGIYLYGFVVQQVVFHLFPDAGVRGNYLISMPIAFLLGTISWYIVERPAIQFGRRISTDNLLAAYRRLTGTMAAKS